MIHFVWLGLGSVLIGASALAVAIGLGVGKLTKLQVVGLTMCFATGIAFLTF